MLLSDKTNISALVGDRCAHPLLLGLANIRMSTRLKSSSDAFLLAALLPIPKFIHKNKRMCGLLSDRLLHECLDIVLEPLKQAARVGLMMNDPLGNLRLCYTPLSVATARLAKLQLGLSRLQQGLVCPNKLTGT